MQDESGKGLDTALALFDQDLTSQAINGFRLEVNQPKVRPGPHK